MIDTHKVIDRTTRNPLYFGSKDQCDSVMKRTPNSKVVLNSGIDLMPTGFIDGGSLSREAKKIGKSRGVRSNFQY